ncbi:hypothetical protein NVIRENTERO_01483 [Sodalis praecaptivus]|nr:hypothetical protein NVIRENTERO_01483 [Sodalis praecaptivus]
MYRRKRQRRAGRHRRDRRQHVTARIHIDKRRLTGALENKNVVFIAQHIFKQAGVLAQTRQGESAAQQMAKILHSPGGLIARLLAQRARHVRIQIEADGAHYQSRQQGEQ